MVNGRKWWSSGAMDPRCRIFIVMGKTDPDATRHKQQCMMLVPRDTPGVTVLRNLTVFGYTDGRTATRSVSFTDVRVPAAKLIGARATASRSPRRGSARAGYTTACGRSAPPSGRSS